MALENKEDWNAPAGPEGLGTISAATAIKRVRYSHDAMVDIIINNPAVSNRQLATEFGFTEAWVSRVTCSDAFQARLAARKEELVDPELRMSLEQRLKGLMNLSMTVLEEKLEAGRNGDMALEVLTISTKALGYGVRKDNVMVQNNYVVALPSKAATAEDWIANCRPESGVRGVDISDAEVATVPSDPLIGS